MKQRTISKPVSSQGIGIHSGKDVKITINPAKTGTGIKFKRTDLAGQPLIRADVSCLAEAHRSTNLRVDGVDVRTIEHLMAAAGGLGISNLEVELDSEELPAFDGSAKKYVELIKEAGIAEQKADAEAYALKKPVWVVEKDKLIVALPSKIFKARYFISFPESFVGEQSFEYSEEMDFSEEIAPARTFGFLKEIEHLKNKGLALGGSLDNAVVIGEDEYLTERRFKDELVRHKVLDLIGDLEVLGRGLKCEIIALQAGHKMHLELVKKIKEELKC
jgi:UDP-3-O-acyl N-acetylglucosamine deacetylase